MLQRDAAMLNGLLKKSSPAVHRHLKKNKVDPLLYMTDWFLCAMTRTLPWDTLLRVWDCFLCEGIKIFFKVALIILGASLESTKVRKSCTDLCETLEVLRSPQPRIVAEDFIMHHIFRLNITIDDFIYEHKKQEAAHRKAKSMQTI
jgi:TBC1 domain family member 10